MPLLDPDKAKKSKKTAVRVVVEEMELRRIEAYCKFSGIEKPEDFFRLAADYVLSKDKEWKKEGKRLNFGQD